MRLLKSSATKNEAKLSYEVSTKKNQDQMWKFDFLKSLRLSQMQMYPYQGFENFYNIALLHQIKLIKHKQLLH